MKLALSSNRNEKFYPLHAHGFVFSSFSARLLFISVYRSLFLFLFHKFCAIRFVYSFSYAFIKICNISDGVQNTLPHSRRSRALTLCVFIITLCWARHRHHHIFCNRIACASFHVPTNVWVYRMSLYVWVCMLILYFALSRITLGFIQIISFYIEVYVYRIKSEREKREKK